MIDIDIDTARLEQITTLRHGAHKSFDDGACVMEAVAYVAGEPWSDHPECVCPVLGTFMRAWNDGLPTDADRDRLLKPLIPKLINTRGDSALEQRRATMAADWLIRVHTPAWLRLAKLDKQAVALALLPEITDFAQCPSLMPTLTAVRDDADAASDAARNAAWNAARNAAWNAASDAAWNAASDAARNAASDAARNAASDAARNAAWNAARNAAWNAASDAAWNAARNAAWNAAWNAASDAAIAAFKPTLDMLEQSALELVERMIALKTSKGGE